MGTLRRTLGQVPGLRPARDYLGYVRRGMAPRWLAQLTMLRKARHPVTFRAKQFHKMAYDRRPVLRQIADKVAAREYVAERVGTDVLTKVYLTADDATSIDWAALPDQYVVKTSHGSGGVVIVARFAPAGDELPPAGSKVWWTRHFVRPEAADHRRLSALAAGWLRLRYEVRAGRFPEWCYRGIPPRILVEELLLDDEGKIPRDYKFFVFDGVCRFVQVDSERALNHTRDIFDPDWNRIDVVTNHPNSDALPPRPRNLERMIEVASALGRGIDFVRIDLYSIGERVVFGELTNYPEGGRLLIDPPSFDDVWGGYWTLPARTRR